jgi:hypothetical protein
MRNLPRYLLAIAAGLLLIAGAHGDSMQSRCGYSADPEVTPESYQSCVFSQRQGYINIYFGDTSVHDFSPDGDNPGTFLDQDGHRVYRKKGLAERGQLFMLQDNYLYVLWDPVPSRLECAGEDLISPTVCALGDGVVGFYLQATGGSSLSTLTLTPIGLEAVNETVNLELDGNAYRAELADLDSNGWPEVYVYVSSAGSGSYGSLVAYAVNAGKSATPIYLPPLTEHAEAARGYQGHDEFRVVENRLVRRFPIYKDTDINAAPSGGTRQLQYRLVSGEAGWVLEIDRVVNYQHND